MKTILANNETLIHKGSANLLYKLDNTGGKLYLTSERLVFEAHKLNFAFGTQEIPLLKIKTVDTGWTKFLGFIPLFPNAVLVTTTEGKRFRFAVWGRKKWVKRIHNAGNNRFSDVTQGVV